MSDRTQTENALKESEERFRQLANAVPQMVWVVSANRELEYANDQWYEYSGLPPGKLDQPDQTLKSLHPEDRDGAVQVWYQAIEAGQPYQYECRIQRAVDRAYRWFLVRAVPSYDEHGQIVRWYGTSTDIDDRKRAEQEREQILERERIARAEAEAAQRQLATLFESASIGMALLDSNQRFVSINAALAEINGLSPEDHLGRTPVELFGHRNSTLVDICNEIYATGKPFTASNLEISLPYRTDRRPGYYSLHYLPMLRPTGEVESMLAYVIDITDRFRLEQAQRFLADSSQVLSSSLDYQTTLSSIARLVVPHLADWCSVHIIDEAGVTRRLAVAHVNPDKVAWADELEKRYPYDPNEPRGVPEVIRTGQSELYPEIPDHLLVEAAKDADHLQILREVGFSSVMIVPLLVQGRSLGAISFVAAESGRRYAQSDLELAEELGRRAALAVENAQLYARAQQDRDRAEAANRVKDEFLAVLSHELRSPLNPILGWAGLLRQGKLDPAKAAYAIETIERNAKLQVQLIEDLLDVSRILRGKLSFNKAPVNLALVIEAALETVKLAIEVKSIKVKTLVKAQPADPTNAPLFVLGDAARLQQVIWNLLSNAVKFTPVGGQIDVQMEQVGSQVQITVSDTGKGISADFLPYVFDYFRQADATTTRKFGGLGLGLAIVHHLVEMHGGTVGADSPGEGQGATFTVMLPILQTLQETEQAFEPPGLLLDLDGIKVLVVDDEADTREFVAFLLEQYGAKVTAVTSAREVLTILPQLSPDLLLSDIGMPETDGYMLLQQIRNLPPEMGGQVPAIALTAYAGEINYQRALAVGFQKHIAKPVEPAELVAAVANLTRLSRRTQMAR
ncbi:ATP-binding protein [Pseudanabaena sp. FACHB-2040]|uniref:hybrid sensor histidine kinase/response regulator n=1 Tax=Pseudanabaena sp. FACHB-2040 TaxID=2692859 RepID=UPI0016895E00|nr:ATP-binding protein [Pseudanabaena sp. FACHB-2040]MBD2255987.1 response regulator [Pseudanabaena sp. FACHB-2040]